ncbi:MAG: cytochrome c3 family protein [Gemmatimonadota bacterium]|nr:MAG: cytochrome c3 family protein [Gemmatimonadota bacterium]
MRGLTRVQVGLLVVALAGAFLAFVVQPSEPERRQGVFMFTHTAGDVVFDHARHVERPESCISCHHELWNTAPRECSSCHGEGFARGSLPHEALGLLHSMGCATCHEDQTDERDPQSCRNCHPAQQDAEVGTVGCDQCHGFERPAGMNHELLMTLHQATGCETCHRIRNVGSAYHDSCTGCHVERNAERFLDAAADVKCGWCHLQ